MAEFRRERAVLEFGEDKDLIASQESTSKPICPVCFLLD